MEVRNTIWTTYNVTEIIDSNWVQTVPGKGWNTIFRLYGPLESWFDQTWKPGEIELVKYARSEGPCPCCKE